MDIGVFGGRLVSSTPALLARLTNARDTVVRLEQPLKRYFPESPTTRLDRVKKALAEADSSQESALQHAPARHSEVLRGQGPAPRDDRGPQPHRPRRLPRPGDGGGGVNKDLLLRARRTGADKVAEPAPQKTSVA